MGSVPEAGPAGKEQKSRLIFLHRDPNQVGGLKYEAPASSSLKLVLAECSLQQSLWGHNIVNTQFLYYARYLCPFQIYNSNAYTNDSTGGLRSRIELCKPDTSPDAGYQ